jgi:hypothetical protein
LRFLEDVLLLQEVVDARSQMLLIHVTAFGSQLKNGVTDIR